MSKWKEVRFDEIGDVFSGGTPSTTNPELWDGDIAFITPYDLSKNRTPYIKQTQRYITQKGLGQSSTNLLSANNLIISSRAPIGYIALSATEFVTNQGCKSLRFFKDQEPLFHYYNFQMYVDEMKRFGVGTTFSEISKGDLCKLKLRIPKENNIQKEVAHILTTCDNVIEQTQSAIAKYKAIKQGMLHDLFTRGLDANGHLNPTYQNAPELYKESELGMIPKEWEVKRLGDIATMKSGDGITSKFITDSGDYPVYGGNGLRGYTTTFTHEGDYVLIGRQGALCGNITRVSNKFFASEHAVVVTVNKDIDVDWLSQKLDAMNLNQYSEASAQPGLAVAKILRLFITKPEHHEQNEIGKRLLALDNKMNAEETLLQKYQSIKRGLMGDLLGGKKNA